MEPITITGTEEIDELDIHIVNKIANENYEKIKRSLKNEVTVALHFKSHFKGGKRKKYVIKLKVIAPTKIFESSASDWDLAKALHMAFNQVENQLKHRLHVDDQHDKSYG